MRYILPLLVAGLFAWAIYWFSTHGPSHPAATDQPVPVLEVETMRLSSQTLRPVIRAGGVLRAVDPLQLDARTAGVVTWVHPGLLPGAALAEGEPLVRLDPRPFRERERAALSSVQEARSALEEELGRVQQARQEQEVWRSRGESARLVSDLALRKPQLAAARARLDAAEATLALSRLEQEYAEITAPYPAMVTAVSVAVGQYVAPGEKLLDLVAGDEAEVLVTIPLAYARWLPEVATGTALRSRRVEQAAASGQVAPVMLRDPLGAPQSSWQSRPVAVNIELDPATRGIEWIVRITEPFRSQSGQPSLRIGQFLSAEIEGVAVPDALVVPAAAVQPGQWVAILESGKILRRRVTTGWQDGEQVQILDGLRAGDEVIVSALGRVPSGTPARALVP